MKPYFLDELRSFKMKDQLSKINTPLTTSQKTALENKVKVLELENNLLKSDVFYMKDLLILTPSIEQNIALILRIVKTLVLWYFCNTSGESRKFKGQVTISKKPTQKFSL